MRARNKFWSPPGWLHSWEEEKQVVQPSVCPAGEGAAAGQSASGATVLSVEKEGEEWCGGWKERNGVVAVALLVVDARLYAFVIVGFVRCSSRHLAFLLVIHPLFYQVQFERHRV